MTEATQETADNDTIGDLLDGDNAADAGESAGSTEPTGSTESESTPKRRGRPPKAKPESNAGNSDSSASANQSVEPSADSPTPELPTPSSPPPPPINIPPLPSNPRECVMAAVSAFADSPAALSSDFIVAAIAEWIMQPLYRKVFHAIGQQYGEAAIYYALAKISPHIPRQKRSGLALGASMAASSVRVMDGGRKAIDQGDGAMLSTQEIANRYANVTREEMENITRES